MLNKIKDLFSYSIDDEMKGSSNILGLIAVIFLVFLAWAYFVELDRVVTATGKSFPTSKLQEVEHYEGGTISEVLVSEGDKVKKNELLLTLSPVRTVGEFNIQKDTLSELLIRQSRLLAEYNGDNEITLPPNFEAGHESLINEEKQFFTDRTKTHKSEMETLKTDIRQAESELELANYELSSSEEELSITRQLFDKGLESRLALLQSETKYAEIRSKKQVAQHRLDGAQHGLAKYVQSYRSDILDELSAVRGKLNEAREQIQIAADKADRLELRAPIDGTIHRILASTIGGTVKSGEPIIEIVPIDDKVVVEASVKPADIGFLRVGQRALVKFTAYDFSIFGAVEGTVGLIPTDTTEEKDSGELIYRVKIQIPNQLTDTSGVTHEIIPGMEAQIDIIVGQRSVLTYIMSPLTRTLQESMREK